VCRAAERERGRGGGEKGGKREGRGREEAGGRHASTYQQHQLEMAHAVQIAHFLYVFVIYDTLQGPRRVRQTM